MSEYKVTVADADTPVVLACIARHNSTLPKDERMTGANDAELVGTYVQHVIDGAVSSWRTMFNDPAQRHADELSAANAAAADQAAEAARLQGELEAMRAREQAVVASVTALKERAVATDSINKDVALEEIQKLEDMMRSNNG